jgi:hypothetical protein
MSATKRLAEEFVHTKPYWRHVTGGKIANNKKVALLQPDPNRGFRPAVYAVSHYGWARNVNIGSNRFRGMAGPEGAYGDHQSWLRRVSKSALMRLEPKESEVTKSKSKSAAARVNGGSPTGLFAVNKSSRRVVIEETVSEIRLKEDKVFQLLRMAGADVPDKAVISMDGGELVVRWESCSEREESE